MQKLTIGMAVHSDYDGVVFTTQSLRLYHHLSNVELIVVDNDPESPEGKATRELVEHKLKGKWTARYIPFTQVKGTSATRDLVFKEASGDVVMCIDSHVLLAPGALYYLMDFYQKNPSSMDLLQGPLIYDDFVGYSTHFQDIWQSEMWGVWGTDPRGEHPDNPPFEIPGQGLGLFACKKEAWLGFNPHFRSFGGEEMYIHEKYRQAGRKTWCLPGLRWWHRFGRPRGVNYTLTQEDKVRNYILGHLELGLPLDRVKNHFVTEIGMPENEWKTLVNQAKMVVKLYGFSLPKENNEDTVQITKSTNDQSKNPMNNTETKEVKRGCGCSGNAPNGKPMPIEDVLASLRSKQTPEIKISQTFINPTESVLEIADQRNDMHASILTQQPSLIMSCSSDTPDAQLNREIGVGQTKVFLFKSDENVKDDAVFDVLVLQKQGPLVSLLNKWKNRIIKRIVVRKVQQMVEEIIEFLKTNLDWTVVFQDPETLVLSKEESSKKALPPLKDKAIHYFKSLTKHAFNGFGDADESLKNKRFELCILCPDRNGEACSLCGCPVKEKGSWASEKCDAGKW